MLTAITICCRCPLCCRDPFSSNYIYCACCFAFVYFYLCHLQMSCLVKLDWFKTCLRFYTPCFEYVYNTVTMCLYLQLIGEKCKNFQTELKTIHRFSVTISVSATHYLKYGNMLSRSSLYPLN